MDIYCNYNVSIFFTPLELFIRIYYKGVIPDDFAETPASESMMVGLICSIVGIIFAIMSFWSINRFVSLSGREEKEKQSRFMLLSLRRTVFSAFSLVLAWVFYTVYISYNDFTIYFLWSLFIPLGFIVIWILVIILGSVYAKEYRISFGEFRTVGQEERKKVKEEKKRKREEERKRLREEREKSQQRREQSRVSRTYASTALTKTIPQSVRLERLEQIVTRTKEMRLTDLRSVLEFQDKPSLMKWLYALEENWKFTIRGDFITFEEESLKREESKITKEKPKTLCLFCEAELQEVEDDGPIVCLNCGKKTPYCEICKNIIHAGQKIVQVKTCQHIFHKNHIVEWIKARGTCPICKEQMNEEFLRPFIPE